MNKLLSVYYFSGFFMGQSIVYISLMVIHNFQNTYILRKDTRASMRETINYTGAKSHVEFTTELDFISAIATET